jgi:hypothetical protein
MTTKCTKWSYNIASDRKIDKMALKIPTSSIERPSKIYPNLDFGFENIPSGNTGLEKQRKSSRSICYELSIEQRASLSFVLRVFHKRYLCMYFRVHRTLLSGCGFV